ncbi:YihY/virulence factor BrkB family protein [Cellulomonas endophytica]|uniref:YihY/virulence factor BrkB family protein n=1 Tax=Cellulomonas endophytica TaxID=2494735 RepID=UPI00101192A6|nr:YihY/virulence factor BrkB family protein [Cellulomonas endophytica]
MEHRRAPARTAAQVPAVPPPTAPRVPPGYGGTGGVEVGPARGAGSAHLTAGLALGEEDPTNSRRKRGFAALLARVQALLAWWNGTRAARANARFGQAGGGVLTGGIAYAALFSVAAGLTIGYTVFMAVLGRNDALRQEVLATVGQSLPGLLKTGPDAQDGLVDPERLQFSSGSFLAGLTAVVVLVVSATAAMGALRTAVRAMFAAPAAGQNAVLSKLREVGGLVAAGLVVLVSTLLTVGATTAADWLVGVLGASEAAGVVARVVGISVSFVVDAGTWVLVVKYLAVQDPPRRDLLQGAAIAGVGLGVVRVLGTSVVAGSASSNPVFAGVTVLATLLVWINLIARIALLAAAWTADPSTEELAAPDATTPADAGR